MMIIKLSTEQFWETARLFGMSSQVETWEDKRWEHCGGEAAVLQHDEFKVAGVTYVSPSYETYEVWGGE